MTRLCRKTVSLSGRNLSYVEEGEGPVLFLGHGLLWSADVWAPLLDRLTPFFRCIAPDLWGHGLSDSFPLDPETVTVEELTAGMEAFVDALGVGSFSIVGLSLGGMWAAQLASRRPARVVKLVLMNTYTGPELPDFSEAALGILRRVEEARGFPEEIIEAFLPLYFADSTLESKPELGDRFRESLRNWPPGALHSVCAIGRGAFMRKEGLGQLKGIACPTLVIAGSEDRVRTLEEAQRMMNLLPNAVMRVLPDAGHVTPLEQPEALAVHLLDFLRYPVETP